MIDTSDLKMGNICSILFKLLKSSETKGEKIIRTLKETCSKTPSMLY